MELLDALDRRLLALLDMDARAPLASMARVLREGTDRVHYRFQRLVEAGVIKSTAAIIDPFTLGLVGYKTYLTFENRPKTVERFITSLTKSQRVFWFAEADGAYDVMFSVYAKSPKEYSVVEEELLAPVQNSIRDLEVFTVLRAGIFSRGYLSNIKSSERWIGEKALDEKIDSVDRSILGALSRNARVTLGELSELNNLSQSANAQRIKKLEENKIIIGYRSELDVSKLDMLTVKAMVYLRQPLVAVRGKILAYCRQQKWITYYIEQLGNCKLELELDVTDFHHYYQVINELRMKFPREIHRIEMVILRNETYRWMENLEIK